MDFSNTIGSASYSLTDSHESSNNGSSKKQGRKSNPTSDRNNISDDSTSHVNWWRGGKLSRQVYQWKRLPRSLASKSGRQGKYYHFNDFVMTELSTFLYIFLVLKFLQRVLKKFQASCTLMVQILPGEANALPGVLLLKCQKVWLSFYSR